jgi:hypothetical protein
MTGTRNDMETERLYVTWEVRIRTDGATPWSWRSWASSASALP